MNLNDWLKAERELLDKATPGPWEAQEPGMAPGIGFARVKGPKSTRQYYKAMCFDRTEDAEFIANVRTSHAEALDTIERMRKQLESAKGALYGISRWTRKSPYTPNDVARVALAQIDALEPKE